MQRAELALRLKEAIAKEAKARQLAQLKKGAEKPVRENSHEREDRTDEKLASLAGVSSNTIRRVEKIVTEAKPAVVDAVRKGEISINAPPKPVEKPHDAPAPKVLYVAPEVEEEPVKASAVIHH